METYHGYVKTPADWKASETDASLPTNECGQTELQRPTNDATLQSVVPVKGMYPKLETGKADTSLVTIRVPMQQPSHADPQPGQQTLAVYGQPGYSLTPSPAATLPYKPHVSGYPPTAPQ
ncbi:unnamed protein product [Fusarium langsethiae]|nr:unnamed protein product [Fusarium langsethiae]